MHTSETEAIEYKKSLAELKQGVVSWAAMLNKHGEADLWFGVASIFKNRVEIRSPGKLYDSLTVDAIVKGNISRRRNPIIADLLRRINFIEAWGRGVPLILENAPDTRFEEIGSLFIAKLMRQATQKTTREQILALLSQDNRMTRKSLAEATGVSDNAIKQRLSNLQKEGMLERKGGRKQGWWKVIGSDD